MCALNDKVVIVTGGSSGIGRAAASSFAKQGAKVIITASRAGPHEEAAADHPNLVRTWSARGSRASIKLGNCSMKSFISTITNGFTPLPEKSRFFAMKELLRKTEACFGDLKFPGIVRSSMIFSVADSKDGGPLSEVSWNALQFSVSGVPIREEVELRISFNLKTRLALIRFWYQDKLVGEQQVKAEDLKKVHF